MSFQDKLDKELERRDLKSEAKTSDATGSSKSFSFKYFTFGLILALCVSIGFAAYAALNKKQTMLTLQERLSSKAALVERTTILPTMTVQPVITMLPNDANDTPRAPADEVKTSSEKQPERQQETPPAQQTKNNTPQNKSVVTEIIPDLYESTALGLKPQRRERDGLTVFEAYKNPMSLSDKPKVAFVIVDLGLSSAKTRQIIKDMPPEISLAFSPYTSGLSGLLKEARKDNHEAWLMLPLQTSNFPLDDPGPLTLLKEVSTAQNKDRLDKLLTLGTGYVGFIPDATHNYTREAVRTSPVFNEILERGLAVIEPRIGSNNFIKELAIKKDSPFGQADFWLDPQQEPVDMKNELNRVVTFAGAKGGATVMVYPYPSSLAAVKGFLVQNKNSIQLAPASSLVTYGG